jgi:hypothetical protein
MICMQQRCTPVPKLSWFTERGVLCGSISHFRSAVEAAHEKRTTSTNFLVTVGYDVSINLH